jgi:hypothetical protein
MTNKSDKSTPIVYVDRDVAVNHTEYVASEPKIQTIYVDREVVKEMPVEVEKIIIQKEAEAVDLSGIQDRLIKHGDVISSLAEQLDSVMKATQGELEMQRRALIAIKSQRDIDRSRRLMLLKRIKKEQQAHKKMEFKLKLAIGASVILSIASLVVKL